MSEKSLQEKLECCKNVERDLEMGRMELSEEYLRMHQERNKLILTNRMRELDFNKLYDAMNQLEKERTIFKNKKLKLSLKEIKTALQIAQANSSREMGDLEGRGRRQNEIKTISTGGFPTSIDEIRVNVNSIKENLEYDFNWEMNEQPEAQEKSSSKKTHINSLFPVKQNMKQERKKTSEAIHSENTPETAPSLHELNHSTRSNPPPPLINIVHTHSIQEETKHGTHLQTQPKHNIDVVPAVAEFDLVASKEHTHDLVYKEKSFISTKEINPKDRQSVLTIDRDSIIVQGLMEKEDLEREWKNIDDVKLIPVNHFFRPGNSSEKRIIFKNLMLRLLIVKRKTFRLRKNKSNRKILTY
jgi:hypothetical protein